MHHTTKGKLHRGHQNLKSSLPKKWTKPQPIRNATAVDLWTRPSTVITDQQKNTWTEKQNRSASASRPPLVPLNHSNRNPISSEATGFIDSGESRWLQFKKKQRTANRKPLRDGDKHTGAGLRLSLGSKPTRVVKLGPGAQIGALRGSASLHIE